MIGNKSKRQATPRLRSGQASDKRQGGFTLVELMVAIAVFATVVTVVSSIFVSSVGSQRKNINNQDVLDNARFVLEIMGRAIRQSCIVNAEGVSKQTCIISPDGTSQSLNIIHPTKGVVAYTLESNQIKENGKSISSSNVLVQGLNFVVKGNGSGDNLQPKVTISISLKNSQGAPGTESTANLQTTVTPRNLQIQ